MLIHKLMASHHIKVVLFIILDHVILTTVVQNPAVRPYETKSWFLSLLCLYVGSADCPLLFLILKS